MKKALGPILIVAAIAVGFFYWRSKNASAASAAGEAQYKLAEVVSGTVKKTVSATGVLKPWRTVDIKSKAGGRVDELKVDVGSIVKKDQVLAMIDPADTMLSVNTAKADIDSATARVEQNSQQHRLQIVQSDRAVITARASLESAKANLAAANARRDRAVNNERSMPDLWQASYDSSAASYNNAQKQHAQLLVNQRQERAQIKSSNDQAVANLANAKANLNRQRVLLEKGFVSQQLVDTAQANHDVMEATSSSAQEKLATLEQEQKAAIEASDARVKQAQAQMNNVKAQKIDIDNTVVATREADASVKQLTAALALAQSALEQAKENRATNGIRELDVTAAKATIARATASFINADTTLKQTTVRAPSDGVILTKYVEQGTIITSALSFSAAGNNILQLGDVTRMYVDVTVDETDIANVNENQVVEVTIDAYPGFPFEGKVARVDPTAIVEQNVTTVHVRVEIDNSATSFQLLKPGMNATCEFVVRKKDDVILVPAEAVRTDDKGSFVEVGSGGKPAPPDPKTKEPAEPGMLVAIKKERRDIKIDLEGNETVEVVSGLKVGEQVVSQTIEPTVPQAGGAFGQQGRPPVSRSR